MTSPSSSRVLLIILFALLSCLALPAQLPPSTYGQWTSDFVQGGSGSLSVGRQSATATRLGPGTDAGKVLIAGGCNAAGPTATAELYDPATGTDAPTGSMAQPRCGAVAVLLTDGKVLITGGSDANGNAISSAELYDPTVSTFSSAGSMNSARFDFAAAELSSGLVLVTGGASFSGGNFTPTDAAEYYVPPEIAGNTTGSWNPLPGMGTARYGHTATTLSDGNTVLVAGGNGAFGGFLSSTETWNAQTLIWTSGPNLIHGRFGATATLRPDGKVLIAGGGFQSNENELFFAGTFIATSSLLSQRTFASAVLLPTGAVLIAGGVDANNNCLDSVEILGSDDLETGASGAMLAPRCNTTATLLNTGDVLLSGGSAASGLFPIVNDLFDPLFTVSPNANAMLTPARQGHTATFLAGGNVLIVGGMTPPFESFAGDLDPSTVASGLNSTAYFAPNGGCPNGQQLCFPAPPNTFVAGPNLNFARWGHTATPLPGFNVLIAGGRDGSAGIAQGELYVPPHVKCAPFCIQDLASFAVTGSMAVPRVFHTATWIPSAGQVLLTGGVDINGNVLNSAELYSPSTGRFSLTGNMTIARFGHTATLVTFADGSQKVLITGGQSSTIPGNATAASELYDPKTGTFSAIASMNVARQWHTSTLLSNGKVLVAGGIVNNVPGFGSSTNTAELFDPANQTFTQTGNMSLAVHHHSATLTDEGQDWVLIAGGEVWGFNVPFSTAQFFDPVTNTFLATKEPLQEIRSTHTATLLNDGRVLIAGGWGIVPGVQLVALSTVDLLRSTLEGPPEINTNLQPDIAVVGTPVTVSGAFFGAQQLDSTITFGGTAATVQSWSGEQIVALVPNISGTLPMTVNVVVTVNGVASNAVPFTVIATTDVSITKTASTTQPTVGTNLMYTLLVTNHGPNTAHHVMVSDPLPSNNTFVSATTSQGTCTFTASFPSGTVNCNLGTIPSSGAPTSATVTIVVITPAKPTPFDQNTATVSEEETDSNPTNNTSSVNVTVLVSGVDLIENALSLPPRTAQLGSMFAVTDTAYNQGSVAAGASVTRYYLSKTGSSILLTGSRDVPALPPAKSSTGTVNVIVPATTPLGTYSVLACANDTHAVPEVDFTNNCFTSDTQVTIIAPDLIETSVTNPPPAATVGTIFSVTDTAQNQGNAAAGPSLTRYYLSPTVGKTTSSTLLTGSRSVPMLALSASSTGTMTVDIPAIAAGTYFLLACANDTRVVVESNFTNNCKASATTILVSGPDFVETSVTNPPAAAIVGNTFSVTDTAFNQGSATAGPSLTRYYLSLTAAKTATSILLTGSRAVPMLAASSSSTGTVNVTIPGMAAGTYFLLACANDTHVVPETNFANNCKASTLRVVISAPDLIVTAVTNPPASPVTGATFSVTDTTHNQGNASSGASVTRYYLSLTAGKTSASVLLTGTRAVPSLATGASSTGMVTVKIPSMAAGTYFLVACANDTFTVVESNSANNCKASATTADVH